MYKTLFGLLRRIDPELAHHAGVLVLRGVQLPAVIHLVRALLAMPPGLKTRALGLEFSNPIGLAAGFDKNAEVVLALGALGFGHVEVGTVTPRAQPGNPRPRLFRLPADNALVNRMGFNNDGAAEVALRLRRIQRSSHRPIVGVNIGKNRDTPLEKAREDYRRCAGELAEYSDYLVVNVSSPNTPGLRTLQDPKHVEAILVAVQQEARGKPVALKLSPDLADEDIAVVAQVVNALDIAGVVATNTTVSRTGLHSDPQLVEQIGEGGLSGAPLARRAEEVLALLRSEVAHDRAIISVGGVWTGADVASRLAAGAQLVQLYTSFVYRGPLVARALARELVRDTP